MSRTSLAASIASLSLTWSPVPAKDVALTEPESVGMSSEKLAEVRRVTQQLVDSKKIAGAVTLVARKGKIVHFHASGVRDIDSGKPMQRDTIFRIYSMTKAITTTAAMQLFEQGKLGLDDPVSKYLPEFKGLTLKDDELVVITMRQFMPYQWTLERELKGIIYDAIEK